MRKSRTWVLAAAGIAVVVLLACLLLMSKDKTGPVITIPSNLNYREGMTDKELLEAVTAIDSRDGDVSDTLIVKSVISLSKGNGVKITYAAQDRHNNISEKSVTVYFANKNGSNTTPEDETEPEETAQETEAATPAEYTEPAPEETAAEETEAPEVAPDVPILTLTTNYVEIARGSDVNWLKFVSDITDDKDDRNTLFKVIMIDNYADVNTPGEYRMSYRCRDTDGNESPVAVLTVRVTE